MSGNQPRQPPPLWDAKALLNIINPAKGTFTCVGDAPSCGRRCRNPIAYDNRAAARRILRKLPQISHNGVVLERRLHELAELSLCLTHRKDQVSTMVGQWYQTIMKEVERTSTQSSARRSRSANRTSSLALQSVENRTTLRVNSHPRSESIANIPDGTEGCPEKGHSEEDTESRQTTASSSEEGCPICYTFSSERCRTPCGHTFCRECISIWLTGSESKVCPMDRRPLRMGDLVHTHH